MIDLEEIIEEIKEKTLEVNLNLEKKFKEKLMKPL
jgi:hypothetical protein